MIRSLPPLLAALLLAGCTTAAPPGAILAAGDSVMAWNGARGVPEALGAALGRQVVDASRSGAHVTNPLPGAAALGFDIGAQLRDGPWSWVVLTGGGNDLMRACGDGAVAARRDALIGEDLTGDIPDLIAAARATGARVAFVGYYDAARAAPTAFTPCQPAFDVMNARLARLAARDPDLVFVDAGTAIDPGDLTLYDPDRVHPSPDGAMRIAGALARAIRLAER